jgi:hypothetical protein
LLLLLYLVCPAADRVGEERAGEGFVQGEDDRADEYKQEQEGVERRAETSWQTRLATTRHCANKLPLLLLLYLVCPAADPRPPIGSDSACVLV